MSRTNVSVLIATALLGVLLLVVREIAQQGPPAGPAPDAAILEPGTDAPDAAAPATPAWVAAPAPDAPRIDSAATLVDFLNSQGIDGATAVREAARWYRERGRLGPIALLGVGSDTAPARYYESLDDATLRALSESGDAGATQALADRRIWNDPLRTLAVDYLEAARQGSVYAAFRAASLWESLAGLDPAAFPPDSPLRRDLQQLQGNQPTDLQYNALKNALVGVQDGGPPVVDGDTLAWLQRLEAALPPAVVEQACNEAFRVYLALGNVRRDRGLPPVNVTPPPVFLAVPDLEAKLPCRDTGNPLFTTLALESCAVRTVRDDAGEVRRLYICAD